MVRCRVLVVAKANGADIDSTNRTGMTTRLQKMVCGTFAPSLYSHCVWLCSYGQLVLSGIVQCVQCHKWSHNTCVGRPAIQNEGQLAEWTCEKCDADMARELHLALNCRSRRGRGCKNEQDSQQEDKLDGILQIQGARQPKRQKHD